MFPLVSFELLLELKNEPRNDMAGAALSVLVPGESRVLRVKVECGR